MRLSLLLLCLGISIASGQNMSIAKDQAKRAANQTPPAQQPPAPAALQAAPVDPAQAATAKKISDLRGDLAAIGKAADAAAAAEQRISLLNHLSAAAQGPKASAAAVRQLAGHLITALAGNKKLATEQAKLARNIQALFNGKQLAAAQQDTLLEEVKKILTGAGVATGDADNIAEDLKAIAAETK